MKFSIKKNIILEQLTNVSKAINSRNIIPILNGIKFELTKNGLNLMASDSNLTIKSFIDVKNIEKIEREGTIIIQSKFLLDIIKNINSNIINFDVIDSLKILIYSNNSEYNLNCLNIEDYPQIELSYNKNVINLKSSELKKMIKKTIFAKSLQESRPILTGLNLIINENIMECIVTDSYRLAKKVIKLENIYPNNVNIIIPGDNISKLESILDDSEDNVELHIFENKILFIYKNLEFQTNLLNGTYPNTSNFIPNEFKHIVTTNLNDFFNCISGAALLTQSKEKNIVRMELKGNELLIMSFASEIGKAENRITISRNNEEDMYISYSAKYMLEALRAFEDDEIIIFLNQEDKPIIIKSTKDDSLTQLILPIRTF